MIEGEKKINNSWRRFVSEIHRESCLAAPNTALEAESKFLSSALQSGTKNCKVTAFKRLLKAMKVQAHIYSHAHSTGAGCTCGLQAADTAHRKLCAPSTPLPARRSLLP